MRLDPLSTAIIIAFEINNNFRSADGQMGRRNAENDQIDRQDIFSHDLLASDLKQRSLNRRVKLPQPADVLACYVEGYRYPELQKKDPQ